MRSRLAMFALCAMSACLPVSAATARTEVEFDTQASNGYSANFEFSSGIASMETWRFLSPVVLLTAEYITKGRLNGDRIHARFGSRGRVAVEFRPSGEVERRSPPRRCEGAPRITRPGVFVGAIRFSGENGYTSFDATRAPGKIESLPRWKCKREKRSPGARRSSLPRPGSLGRQFESGRIPLGLDPEAEWFTVLDAEAGNHRTSFNAAATRPRGRAGETTFIASRLEPRPRLLIVRTAFAHGTDETFTFDEALSMASAEPPQPFEGSASFARDPSGRSGSWLGPLTVDFPGADDVPLAGEDFHARLFRSRPFGSGG
jgi:hypothetical protein